MRNDMVRAYVEKLLRQLTGTDATPVTDDDGDYPVRFRQALYFVRLVGDVDPVVQVFSTALAGVSSTPELLAEINDINGRVRFVRVLWVRDQVLVEVDLIGGSLDRAQFENACTAVATVTDHIGPLLQQTFGGTTAFADEKEADAAAPAAPTGLYL